MKLLVMQFSPTCNRSAPHGVSPNPTDQLLNLPVFCSCICDALKIMRIELRGLAVSSPAS
jgi:hypothetical protein